MDIEATSIALAAFVMAWLERLRALKAEKKLEDNNWKAVFPIFRLYPDPFEAITEDKLGNRRWDSKRANVLSVNRSEIDKTIPQGTSIAMVLDWQTKIAVPAPEVWLDKKQIQLFFGEAPTDKTEVMRKVCIIEYPYIPLFFGRLQTMEFKMAYRDLKQTSKYQITHGSNSFVLMDPGSRSVTNKPT